MQKMNNRIRATSIGRLISSGASIFLLLVIASCDNRFREPGSSNDNIETRTPSRPDSIDSVRPASEGAPDLGSFLLKLKVEVGDELVYSVTQTPTVIDGWPVKNPEEGYRRTYLESTLKLLVSDADKDSVTFTWEDVDFGDMSNLFKAGAATLSRFGQVLSVSNQNLRIPRAFLVQFALPPHEITYGDEFVMSLADFGFSKPTVTGKFIGTNLSLSKVMLKYYGSSSNGVVTKHFEIRSVYDEELGVIVDSEMQVLFFAPHITTMKLIEMNGKEIG